MPSAWLETLLSFCDRYMYEFKFIGLQWFCNSGEIMLGNLQIVFARIDEEGEGNLSKSRFKKDKKDWANTDFWLQLNFSFLYLLCACINPPLSITTQNLSLELFMWPAVNAQHKEAYVVQSLLSYARKYWRKSLIKRTLTPEAVQLQAVCRPNPRRARESCKKIAVPVSGGDTCSLFINVDHMFDLYVHVVGPGLLSYQHSPVPASMSTPSSYGQDLCAMCDLFCSCVRPMVIHLCFIYACVLAACSCMHDKISQTGQEIASGSGDPIQRPTMEEIYGPGPDVPQGFSQIDVDTTSKQNAIKHVMNAGVGYHAAVQLLEYCDGDVAMALDKLEHAQTKHGFADWVEIDESVQRYDGSGMPSGDPVCNVYAEPAPVVKRFRPDSRLFVIIHAYCTIQFCETHPLKLETL